MQTSPLSLAHIPWVSKCDTVIFFDMKLKLTHGLKNQSSSLAYRMATGECRSWLPTQVALDVVHHLRGAGEGLFLVFAGTKKDASSLFAAVLRGPLYGEAALGLYLCP
jgi:hypothetical protein